MKKMKDNYRVFYKISYAGLISEIRTIEVSGSRLDIEKNVRRKLRLQSVYNIIIEKIDWCGYAN
jgi:hypothetical protein